MDAVFLKILNMSLAASWLVLAVLILRLVLKKAPKWVHCTLWALVAVRLLCPFSFESVFSLVPSGEVLPTNVISTGDIQVHTGFEAVDTQINSGVLERYMEGVTVPVGNTSMVMTVLACVWLVGMALMAGYGLFSYQRIKGKVGASMEIEPGVRICDYIESPFILGIRRPVIYLPSHMEGEALASVLAHERAHIARRDHWWKPLGYLLLTIHWFNPVLWLAYILLCRDIEMACDEKVIRDMGAAERKKYTQALLACSLPRHLITACPLAFGEVGVKDRVKGVLNYKKPAFWIILVAVIACVVTAVCFLTDPAGATLARQWNVTGSEVSGVMLTSGEGVYVFIEEEEIHKVLDFLKEARLQELPISQSRSEDRAKDHSITLYNGTSEMVFHFDSDFSDVWVDDGVKPSLSYRLEDPDQVKAFFEAMLGTDIPEAVYGGPDESGNYYFYATVLEAMEKTVLVEPVEGCKHPSCDQIWVSLNVMGSEAVPVLREGDQIKVVYDGMVAETYPAQVNTVYAVYLAGTFRETDTPWYLIHNLQGTDVAYWSATLYGGDGSQERFLLDPEQRQWLLGILNAVPEESVSAGDGVADLEATVMLNCGSNGEVLLRYGGGVVDVAFTVEQAERYADIGSKKWEIRDEALIQAFQKLCDQGEDLVPPFVSDNPNGTRIDFSREDVAIRMTIPAGWEFVSLSGEDGGNLPGVTFWPKGHEEGKISVQYQTAFGVCGTGLVTEDVSMSGFYGSTGYYDGSDAWSYICLRAKYGSFVIRNESDDTWWSAYEMSVMEILSTLELEAPVITEEEAIAKVEEMAKYYTYDMAQAELDSSQGCWIVRLYRDDGKTLTATIRLDMAGNQIDVRMH